MTSAMEDYIHFQNTERLQENRKGLSHLEYRTKAF
ncbi:IS3 family transposase [Oceanobacillus sp. 1P07AA]